MQDRQTLTNQTNEQSALFKRAACIAIALLCATTLSVASAEEASLKDGAKRAGHAIGTVARDVGQGAKKVGKAVGKAAKEGGREFRRAIKGESH
jgi:hypothetical protein